MTALGLGAITDTLNGQDEDLQRLRESYAGELELRLLREQKEGEANQ
jgi:hypothetical protein